VSAKRSVGRPDGLRVVVRESISTIDSAVWNGFFPDAFRSTHAWLTSVAGAFEATSAFLLAEEDGVAVGALAAYLLGEGTFFMLDAPRLTMADALDPLIGEYYTPDERARAADLRSLVAGRLPDSYPCAVCVSPFGYTAPVAARGDRVDVYAALVAAFDALAVRWGAPSRSFLYVPDGHSEALRETLLDWGYRPAAIAARCLLPIPWTSFEGYVASLSGSRRQAVRRELRRIERNGLDFEIVDGSTLGEVRDRLAHLSARLMEKYGHGYDIERELATFRTVEHHIAGMTRVFLARRDGEIVAFAHGYEWGPTLGMALTGQDYEAVGSRSYAHFQTTYYEPIRYAIARGLRLVDFGVGGYEAKLNRGCTLSPLIGYFRLAAQPDALGELLKLVDAAQSRFVALRGRPLVRQEA
jgi:predicted N-acyltransferase